MTVKWKIFKERVPDIWNPQWVLWDDYGEYTFRSGEEALAFADQELRRRELSQRIVKRQEILNEQLG